MVDRCRDGRRGLLCDRLNARPMRSDPQKFVGVAPDFTLYIRLHDRRSLDALGPLKPRARSFPFISERNIERRVVESRWTTMMKKGKREGPYDRIDQIIDAIRGTA